MMDPKTGNWYPADWPRVAFGDQVRVILPDGS